MFPWACWRTFETAFSTAVGLCRFGRVSSFLHPTWRCKVLNGRESPMRLLVVEDDISIQQFLKRALVEAGYQVDTATMAKTGEAIALEGIHDAFIIDLGLPDMDGLDLIARCRAQGSSVPVLILSARRSVNERVKGLDKEATTILPS